MNPVVIYICLIKELTFTMGENWIIQIFFNRQDDDMLLRRAASSFSTLCVFIPHVLPLAFTQASDVHCPVRQNERRMQQCVVPGTADIYSVLAVG